MSRIRSSERSRRRLFRAIAWTAALACGLAAGGQALARPQPPFEAPATIGEGALDIPLQRGGGLSLQQAIRIAESRYQGRVVRADTTVRNGRVVHEIRILGDDGRVRTVQIDAQGGESR